MFERERVRERERERERETGRMFMCIGERGMFVSKRE